MPGPTNKHRYDEFHRGLVPQDHLGTGGDGSGDHVLHDDGTWQDGAGGTLDSLTDVTITAPSDGDALTYSSGEWVNAAPAASGNASGQFIYGFSADGLPITAGATQDVLAPFDGTITGWTILADLAGTATLDLWKTTYAGAPPTDANSITGASPPTLSGVKSASTDVSGWTVAVTAGDVITVHLDAVSAVTRLLLVVAYSRP